MIPHFDFSKALALLGRVPIRPLCEGGTSHFSFFSMMTDVLGIGCSYSVRFLPIEMILLFAAYLSVRFSMLLIKG